MLWHLGTVVKLGIPTGFVLMCRHACTDPNRYVYPTESIENVTDNYAHNNTVSLLWVYPSYRVLQRCQPGAPAEFRGVGMELCVTRFPRVDAIDCDVQLLCYHHMLSSGVWVWSFV